jgi:outer membrane protein TolC
MLHGRRLGVPLLWLIALAGEGFAQSAADSQSAATPDAVAVPAPQTLPSVTLDECLAASLVQAPGLKTAKLGLDTASAQLGYTLGSNGLTLGESAGYFYQFPLTSSSSLSPASSGVDGNNFKAGLSLAGPATSVGLSAQQGLPASGSSSGPSTLLNVTGSQVVYDGYPGGRSKGLIKQADYTFKVAQVNYAAALESLAYQVKQEYYTLLGDQNSLVARQATVEQATEALSQMQGYYKAARATTLDILQFQVALTQARLDLRTQQNTIDSDREKLSLAVGWPLDKSYRVVDVPSPSLPSLDQKQALDLAYRDRPELKALDLNIAYAGVDLALQKSLYAPAVSITGALGFGQYVGTDTTVGGNDGTVSLGATIALPPIYDGRQQASLVRQKTDAIESYGVQRDQERQSIAIDVMNALFSVKDTSDRLDLAGQNLSEAQGVYVLQQAKFRAGTASSVDVSTAFAALAAAQVGLATAKSAYNLAILNLYNVMGQ